MRLKTLTLLLLITTAGFGAGVKVQFDPRSPEIGPFPTDFLTTPDSAQRTGRRVNLPAPDCQALPSDCGEVSLINQLDGFNPNARLTVKFSGPIDTSTLRKGVFYVWLDPLLAGRAMMGAVGKVTPINKPIWDPATNTAYAKPDVTLESARRYMIVVTDAVRDVKGDPVEADYGLDWCVAKQIGGDYCAQFSAALSQAAAAVSPAKVVGASLYTALSATSWFEQAATVIAQSDPRFALTPATNAPTTSITMTNLLGIVLHRQTATSGAAQFTDSVLPLSADLVTQFGIGGVAFGSFQSPQFIGANLTIPNVPTLAAPAVTGMAKLGFHVWLPKTPPPARGYPVILAGHGYGDDSFGLSTVAAAANAMGYAAVGMNSFGHGDGPLSTVRFVGKDGSVVEFAIPGRGVDVNGDGQIGDGEGCTVITPGNPAGLRDCLRQTVVDYLQLIRTIKAGIDLNGDGKPDLDGSSISYLGQSLGGDYGALLTSLSPDIQASVLNVALGEQTDARLSKAEGAIALALFALRQPSLLNNGAGFIDDIPLRDQPVKVRSTPGAAALQDFIERVDWMGAMASDVVLGPLMKPAPLPGQTSKRVLFQMALGDETVANASTSAIIRAADSANLVSLYRHDIARAIDPTLPENPHTYLIPLGTATQSVIGLATLQQALTFLASGANTIPDVNPLVRFVLGKDLFEQPPATLPEQ
ncbi:MAG: Ig-like domain-containing protein [Acidobacteria bacterium]|nr:Ig-like domain-containing protein [Acidobacteriota bacterium]